MGKTDPDRIWTQRELPGILHAATNCLLLKDEANVATPGSGDCSFRGQRQQKRIELG